MRVSGGLLAILVTVASASSRLDVIDLPTGFSPEGITSGGGWIAFVGSLVGECRVVVVLAAFISLPIGFSCSTTCDLETAKSNEVVYTREECRHGVFSDSPWSSSGQTLCSVENDRWTFSHIRRPND